MSELIVLAFKDEATAKQAEAELQSLQKQQLIELADAAVVTRRRPGNRGRSLTDGGEAWRCLTAVQP